MCLQWSPSGQIQEFLNGAQMRGSGRWDSPAGIEGQSPGREYGVQRPQQRKQNVNLLYKFLFNGGMSHAIWLCFNFWDEA